VIAVITQDSAAVNSLSYFNFDHVLVSALVFAAPDETGYAFFTIKNGVRKKDFSEE
jgi:hypothetical protein